jgi:hypothetical protein
MSRLTKKHFTELASTLRQINVTPEQAYAISTWASQLNESFSTYKFMSQAIGSKRYTDWNKECDEKASRSIPTEALR